MVRFGQGSDDPANPHIANRLSSALPRPAPPGPARCPAPLPADDSQKVVERVFVLTHYLFVEPFLLPALEHDQAVLVLFHHLFGLGQ